MSILILRTIPISENPIASRVRNRNRSRDRGRFRLDPDPDADADAATVTESASETTIRCAVPSWSPPGS